MKYLVPQALPNTLLFLPDADRRYRELLAVVTAQADADGRYTAGSMYQAWKGWSFADKKTPSPWLTFLVERIVQRTG